MKVIVQSKTLKLTQALQAFATRQAQKILKTGTRVSQVRVYLEKVKRKNNDPHGVSVRYRAEVPGKDIFVRIKAKDMYNAIVKATEGASRKIRKTKEKKRTQSRKTLNQRHLL